MHQQTGVDSKQQVVAIMMFIGMLHRKAGLSGQKLLPKSLSKPCGLHSFNCR
jgi:hypothetical protein